MLWFIGLTETSPDSFWSETEKLNKCNNINNDSSINIQFHVIKQHIINMLSLIIPGDTDT